MLDTGDFGPYRIIKRLGVGGMAETFEATRKGPGGFEQRVCLKRVLPAFSENQEFVEQFEREARLAAQLRHSNIVSIIDFGHEEEVHYMALELVDGIDLRTLLAAQPQHKLSADIVGLIGLDMAYALDYAHSLCGQISADGKLAHGIVHRDVSPANVLVSRSGEVKLADFGIAKVINNTVATTTGTIRGKIPYMAPEQMKGIPTDGRADLFSLGVMMFEAMAGKRPFEGSHDVEVMTRILDGNRSRLEDVAPDTPEKLKIAINNLLEHDRDKRTPDANALIDQLANTTHIMRARRQLATLVEDRLGGTETREHLLHAAGPDDETGLAEEETEEGVTDRLLETELMGGDESFEYMPTTAEGRNLEDKTDKEVAHIKSVRASQRSWMTWTLGIWMTAISIAVVIMFTSWNSPTVVKTSGTYQVPKSDIVLPPEDTKTKKKVHVEKKNPVSDDQLVVADQGNEQAGDHNPEAQETVDNEEPADKPEGIALNPPDIDDVKVPRKPAKPKTEKNTPRANAPAETEGVLKVVVNPWGDVWLNGVSIPNRGRGGIPLKPGTYKLAVGRVGTIEQERFVKITAGKTTNVDFKLDND